MTLPAVSPTPARARQWHALETEAVLRALDSNAATGLATAEARRRLQVWGPNALEEPDRRSPFRILLAQFVDVIVLVLLAAAALAALMGELVDLVAILVIV